LLISQVKSSDLNTDMCKFELSQKGKSRAQPADSSEAYSKPGAFKNRVKAPFIQPYFPASDLQQGIKLLTSVLLRDTIVVRRVVEPAITRF